MVEFDARHGQIRRPARPDPSRAYPPRIIVRALCLYNLGHTQEEVVRRLLSEFHLNVPRRTVSNWIAAYRPIATFHCFRSAAIAAFGHQMLRERTLHHQQEYQCKLHVAKLALTAGRVTPDAASRLESYLLGIFEGFPDHLFQDDGISAPNQGAASTRSSRCTFETLPFMRIEKEIWPTTLLRWAVAGP